MKKIISVNNLPDNMEELDLDTVVVLDEIDEMQHDEFWDE